MLREEAMRIAQGIAVLLLVSGVAVSTASGQTPATEKGGVSAAPDRFFRIEAQGDVGKGGRPRVSGYVYNSYGMAATRVQLRVESLDAGGQVVATGLIYVDEIVPAFNRAYFEGWAPAPGASYRVSVRYYEWLKGGF
jgi:hypothetical protein